MIGTAPAPTSPAPGPGPAGRRGRTRAARALIGLAIVGMVGIWVYVMYLSFGPGRAAPPDELDDPTFAIAAQDRCREALDAVGQLPRAADTPTATERAEVIADANAIFATMLDDLAAATPAGEDGELVTAWLADWHTFLEDRESFATALRSDPGARMLVSAKDGQHITEYLDAFAGDNDMPACSTPIDV